LCNSFPEKEALAATDAQTWNSNDDVFSIDNMKYKKWKRKEQNSLANMYMNT
jgi:hypothetical protein